MYSHNFPTLKSMYRGSAKVATRYYFSLLSRPHEEVDGQSANRCITFYIGEEVRRNKPDCLFGLMLRGVSGTFAETKDYAVGIPFVAISLGPNLSLMKISPVDLRPRESENKLYRLHPTGSLIVGDITKHSSEELFVFCEKIFKSELIEKSLFEGNSLVLHTVPQGRLKSLGLREKTWRACLDKTFP